MVVKSTEKKLSFEILSRCSFLEDATLPSIRRSSSDPISVTDAAESPREYGKRKRQRRSKKKKNNNKVIEVETIPEDGYSHSTIANGSLDNSSWISSEFGNSVVDGEWTMFENRLSYLDDGSNGSCVVPLLDGQTLNNNGFSFGELRQRNVNVSFDGNAYDERFSDTMTSDKETGAELSSSENPLFHEVQNQFPRSEPNENVVTGLDTEVSLDWQELMAKDPYFLSAETKSPMKYFMEEIYGGISLRSTTTSGSEKERERIYDTIFGLPWRCEVLINTGFFVCVNSFLSLLTIMPIRVLLIFWDTFKNRQFRRPSSSELSDLACFLVLASGTALLGRTDISLIYHMIRGQSTIKLYVVYNILEIFDKLCQSFCGDVFGALFSSAEGLATSPPEKLKFWTRRLVFDQALTMTASNILKT